MQILKLLLFTILLIPFAASSDSEPSAPLIIKHQLSITLKPKANALEVKDVLTLPDNGQSAFRIQLNSQFHLRYKKRPLHPIETHGDVSSYHLAVDDSRQLELHYKGKLESTPDCAWLKQTCVLLNKDGVFLDGNSHWYPQLTGALHQFDMTVKLPKKWVSLSQGNQTKTGWQEDNPQRAIYLVAGAFQVYESQPDPAQPKAMVYLQHKDPKLAQRYLKTTHQYLRQYSNMLGDYPYTKFVTVESFWETGWGMPSFTLLGSKVLRLPFILHSSFPHEILHNWWGNSVYVDSSAGNWSEGLTAYLADHYNKTSKAERVAYRRTALQKYQTQVIAGTDFPLQDFRGRHDRTTQAVGYSKALMLFHMLRKKLGNKQFFAGLRLFYQQYQFNFAGFAELQQAFSSSSQIPLDTFFQQWLERTGAPIISVSHSQIMPDANNQQTLQLTLQQQTKQPFAIDIPLKVQHQSGNANYQTLRMNKSKQVYTLHLPATAQRLSVDPAFDLLRLPDTREVPPTLNALFSRQKKVFIMPSAASKSMDKAWKEFTGVFSYDPDNVPMQYDSAGAPQHEVVIILGTNNALLPSFLKKNSQAFELTATNYVLNGENYSRASHSLALTLQYNKQQIILLDTATSEGLQILAQKLPHYGKYSYTLFNRTTTKNVAKGQWQMKDSPMTIQLKQ